MRLPSIPDVPYLDVVAARNDAGDKLTLFCVNRHLTRDIVAHIPIAGFAAAPDGSVQTLLASSILEKNDEAHREELIPRESVVKVDGAKRDYIFRHESITIIELHKKN